MNAQQLARMYDRLTVWERIPLLIAATARSDNAEYQRLMHASPIRQWHFPEHLLAEQALNIMAVTYVTTQLDAAANHFFAIMQLANEPRSEDWVMLAETSAYCFSIKAQAWKRFCAEVKVDSAALTAANYHGWLLQYAEKHMPAVAPTPETLQARRWRICHEDGRLITVESILAGWRSTLREMTRHAPPPTKEAP